MPGMYKSFKTGKLTSVPKVPTLADGIAIEHVGAIPFEQIKHHVDDMVLVDEDEIAAGVLTLLEKEKTVCEGSGAAGLAAVMSGKIPNIKGKTVAILCTGGNIDMTLLGRIIEKGLVKSGRLARVSVTVNDVPGQLAR
jgi:threonine dehydratase